MPAKYTVQQEKNIKFGSSFLLGNLYTIRASLNILPPVQHFLTKVWEEPLPPVGKAIWKIPDLTELFFLQVYDYISSSTP